MTVPDPGDFERAVASECEMVLSVPVGRLQELMDGVYHFEEIGLCYRRFAVSMQPGFKQSPVLRRVLQALGVGRTEGVDARRSTRRNSSPYFSSFFTPTPLTASNPPAVVGLRAAISRSVASWKMT